MHKYTNAKLHVFNHMLLFYSSGVQANSISKVGEGARWPPIE